MDEGLITSHRLQAITQELYANEQRARPSVFLRARIFRDGNQWCALYGTNIAEGVCGFGDSPDLAAAAFDRAWYEKIAEPRP